MENELRSSNLCTVTLKKGVHNSIIKQIMGAVRPFIRERKL